MTTPAKCQEPGCTGSILDGYCDVCGTPRATSAGAASTGVASPEAAGTGAAAAALAAEEEPITPAARPQAQVASAVPNGTPCAQPGCQGHILDGYCDVCGTAADSDPAESAADPSPMGSTRSVASNRLSSTAIGSARARQTGTKATRRVGASSQRVRSGRLGACLTVIPP
ncbi:MAG: serine/threonine protein kinase, partial [Dermatophilaceae bacterium]|nr:serine/threonine protein kinase [Dermatophilaceae bacterium]